MRTHVEWKSRLCMGNNKAEACCSNLGVTFTVRESSSSVNPLTSLHLLSQLDSETINDLKKNFLGQTSVAIQWVRIHLPMQGELVPSPVWEDSTCHGATKPMSHKYWSHKPQLLKPVLRPATTETQVPRACAAQQEEPPQGEAHVWQGGVAPAHRN